MPYVVVCIAPKPEEEEHDQEVLSEQTLGAPDIRAQCLGSRSDGVAQTNDVVGRRHPQSADLGETALVLVYLEQRAIVRVLVADQQMLPCAGEVEVAGGFASGLGVLHGGQFASSSRAVVDGEHGDAVVPPVTDVQELP